MAKSKPSSNGFTPTERRILALLSDGLPHTRYEIRAKVFSEASTFTNIQTHMCAIRSKLPKGETITCELRKHMLHYRHIRLLNSPCCCSKVKS